MTAAMQPPPDEGNEHDDMDEAVKARFMEQANQLQEGAETIQKVFSKIGLYCDGGMIVPQDTPLGPRPALVVPCGIGTKAFTAKVQDPESKKMDDDFKAIEKSMADDDFIDKRDAIQRKLDAGENPFADDDDDV